jgi:hypothetical protein
MVGGLGIELGFIAAKMKREGNNLDLASNTQNKILKILIRKLV